MCYLESKKELVKIVKKLGKNKLLPGTSGNVSIRYNDNKILLTSSGSSSAFITYDDIVLTDIEGNIIEKTQKKPSSSAGLMHSLTQKFAHIGKSNVSLDNCPKDFQWVCANCGHIEDHWEPICSQCGEIGRSYWHLYVDKDASDLDEN